jgi:hypothetical protein
MMRRKHDEKEGKEPSYGRIMTNLLIPRDLRSNPRRVVSGIAFIALIVVFLFAALSRSCQPAQPLDSQPGQQSRVAVDVRVG